MESSSNENVQGFYTDEEILESIRGKLESNIEVNLNEEAKKFNTSVERIKKIFKQYNENRLIGFVTGSRIIPIEKFLEFLKVEIRRNEMSLIDLSTRLEVGITELNELLIKLVEKGKL